MDSKDAQIQHAVTELNKLFERIKKNPGRKYSVRFINDKNKELLNYFNVCKSIIDGGTLIDKIQGESVLIKIKTIIEEIKKGLIPKDPVEERVEEEEEEEVQERTEHREPRNEKKINMASFSDVEGALEKFDGRNKPVAVWFTAFENVAVACEFSEVQKYLYCRRLLQGAARLAVEAEADVGDFAKLKAYLVRTFTEVVKVADVYRELASTRKTSTETSEQYAFRMKRIAGGQAIDGPSMVDFIVAGLPGSPLEKAGLMAATSFESLREKLPAYDKLQAAINGARSRTITGRPEGGKSFLPGPRVSSNNNIRPAVGVCFSCGRPGHRASECFSKVKCEKCKKIGHNATNCRVVKCFKCGLEGHVAPNCPRTQA